MENKIGSGRTAEVFKYENSKILKLYIKNFPKNIAVQEYEINKKINRLDIPMAKCLDFIEKDGRYGIVFEEIKGSSMMNLMAKEPWKVKKYAKKCAELHFGIHKEIDTELADNKEQLKYGIEHTDLLTSSDKNKIFSYIDKLQNANRLCHGDFHPDNILVSPEKEYVIDWMTATIGNPCSDLARTALLFKYGSLPEEKNRFEKAVINFGRKKFLSEYLKEYVKLSNVSIKDIEKWELPHMAGRLVEWVPEKEKELLLKNIHLKLKTL